MSKLRFLAVTTALVFSGAARAADQPVSTAGNLFQALFGLFVVLALMAGALWLLKRTGIAKATGGGVVRIVGGVSVGNRERVIVLEVADQWIVVGVASGQVSSLATLPRQEQPASAATVPDANLFSSWLKQKIEKRNAS